MRLFGVTGWKNAGKTTLVCKLVTELTRRGYKVSTVKHAHHSFDIDRPGADSWLHREAGAAETALVSSRRIAIMAELRGEAEPPLSAILARMAPCDLVLIEGYKRDRHEKIEVIRGENRKDTPLWGEDPTIVAVAAAVRPAGCALPVFDPDDAMAIADLIETRTGLVRRAGPAR
jgi:molybdopterin-guanine dinucleotide biosynthesis protein B